MSDMSFCVLYSERLQANALPGRSMFGSGVSVVCRELWSERGDSSSLVGAVFCSTEGLRPPLGISLPSLLLGVTLPSPVQPDIADSYLKQVSCVKVLRQPLIIATAACASSLLESLPCGAFNQTCRR